MDPEQGDLRNTNILIDHGRIEAVGENLDVADAEVIDGQGQMVLPGLVDTHNHMWQTQMRGMFGQTQESLFFPLTQKLSPHFRPEDIWLGEYLAAIEMSRPV